MGNGIGLPRLEQWRACHVKRKRGEIRTGKTGLQDHNRTADLSALGGRMGPSRSKSITASRKDRCGFGMARGLSALLLALVAAWGPSAAKADFGGISFWLPGTFGSLTAVPGHPGWAWATLYIHLSSEASGGKTFQRGGSLVAGLQARVDAVAFGPTYVFETPVLGGQASVSVLGAYGRASVDISATLTGPRGGAISGHRSESLTDFSDVFWQGALKWNQGVNNYMIYLMGNAPVAEFDPTRLVNLGFGHWSVDGGAAYTYFNPQTGYEFSVAAGLTYNFVNPHIDYQNGIDFHVDWGASKFLNQHVQIGAVGYAFQQITGDSGSGAVLGDFKGRVFAIGPQVGFIFPAWEGYQGYVNVKGYKEFGAENRPEGYNVWVTLAFSPTAPTPQPRRPMIVK
jgi:hypothetical protein